jgi:hypothetical protein
MNTLEEEGGGEHSNSNVASKNVRAQLPTLATTRTSPVVEANVFPTVGGGANERSALARSERATSLVAVLVHRELHPVSHLQDADEEHYHRSRGMLQAAALPFAVNRLHRQI